MELPFSEAVTVTAVSVVTDPAVAVKLALVACDATVTEAGAVSAVLLSDSVTAVGEAAGDDRLTVQVEVAPETMLAGEHISDDTEGGCTVIAAVLKLPLSEAVTVTALLAVTGSAMAMKMPVVARAATVTEAGTVSAVLLSDSVTAVADIAAAGKLTVQMEIAPETMVAGEHVSDDSEDGLDGSTVIDAVLELPFSEAVTVTAVFAVTDPAVAIKMPVEVRAATVTEAGTVSAVLLSDSVTATAETAGADRLTVQVKVAPETMLAGEHISDDSEDGLGGSTVIEAVLELPFSEAVTLTTLVAVTVPAVALKLAVVARVATVTEAGTTSPALPYTATAVPPVGAACEIVTVQSELPPHAMEVDVQLRPVTMVGVMVWLTVIAPPVPLAPIETPPDETAIVLLKGSATNPLLWAVIVTETTATTPLPMVLRFIPDAKHKKEPDLVTQFRVLPAAVRAAPAVALIDATSEE